MNSALPRDGFRMLGVLGLLALTGAGCATAPAPAENPVTPAADTATPKDASAAPPQNEKNAAVGVAESNDVDADVRADFDEAMKLLKSGDYAKGAELLQKVTQRSPRHTVPYINLAIAYQQMGNLTAAEESIKKALEISPANPVANTEYGLIYRKTGRFAQARQIYEQTLKRYPKFLPARRNLGILCDVYLQDLDCALAQYRLYNAAVPDDKTVAIWIADLEKRTKKQ